MLGQSGIQSQQRDTGYYQFHKDVSDIGVSVNKNVLSMLLNQSVKALCAAGSSGRDTLCFDTSPHK